MAPKRSRSEEPRLQDRVAALEKENAKLREQLQTERNRPERLALDILYFNQDNDSLNAKLAKGADFAAALDSLKDKGHATTLAGVKEAWTLKAVHEWMRRKAGLEPVDAFLADVGTEILEGEDTAFWDMWDGMIQQYFESEHLWGWAKYLEDVFDS